MRYGFSNGVNQVLALARDEAVRLQHERVGSEHILLGLLLEGEGLATTVLARLSTDPDEIRQRVEQSVVRGKAVLAPGAVPNLPYTAKAKKVLEFALAEAREQKHGRVDTEHLLLGLLREGRGLAAQMLNQLGVTLEGARRETLRLLEAGIRGPEPEERPVQERFTVTIDDASSSSIYEQIVAQLQEAIATGRVRPGDRLPTVRQLADELDIAPGTVARAYSELERLGIVVTEGARGTRVAMQPRQTPAAAQRPETLVGLLRPAVVAAFHLGASGNEVRAAFDQAMRGIFSDG
jgi:DNA-binding transcriptional regulator YhcF (GntR family)